MSNKNNFFSIANNLENLEENKGYLIWIRCGAFFVVICANAVILSNILGLKRICIKQGVCKVGIPVNSIYDYIKKLERIGDSFVIYNYSKDEMVENGKKYAEAYRSKGRFVDKSRITINCEECPNYKKIYYNVNVFEELKRLQELKESTGEKDDK